MVGKRGKWEGGEKWQSWNKEVLLVHGHREEIEHEKLMRRTHLSRYMSEAPSVANSHEG